MSLQHIKDQIEVIQSLRISATYALESLEKIEALMQSNLSPETFQAFAVAEYKECQMALDRVRHLALKTNC